MSYGIFGEKYRKLCDGGFHCAISGFLPGCRGLFLLLFCCTVIRLLSFPAACKASLCLAHECGIYTCTPAPQNIRCDVVHADENIPHKRFYIGNVTCHFFACSCGSRRNAYSIVNFNRNVLLYAFFVLSCFHIYTELVMREKMVK